MLSLYFAYQSSHADKTRLFNAKSIYIISFFVGFEVLQGFVYEFYFFTILRILLHMIWAFSIIKIFKDNFFNYYIIIIYYLILLAFPIFFILHTNFGQELFYPTLTQFFPVPHNIEGVSIPTIIIYTFDKSDFTRFPAFAWEAGALAAFIIPALYIRIINLLSRNIKFYNDRISLLFLLAVFFTYSTTAYFVIIFITISLVLRKKEFKYKIAIIPLLFISFTIYDNVPFLRNKVESQLAKANYSNNRFGAALKDLSQFWEKPIVGWSRKIKYKYGIEEKDVTISDLKTIIHRPNGITNLLAAYGIVYFILYFILIYFGIHRYLEQIDLSGNVRYFSIIFIIILFILGFSQLLFGKVFFKSFLFLSSY